MKASFDRDTGHNPCPANMSPAIFFFGRRESRGCAMIIYAIVGRFFAGAEGANFDFCMIDVSVRGRNYSVAYPLMI